MQRFDAKGLVRAGRAFAMHYIGVEQPWRFPEHRHRGFSELIYVARGAVEQSIDGRPLTQRVGELLLVREHDRHALAGGSFLYCNINVTAATWRSLMVYLAQPALERALWGPDAPVMRVPEARRASFEAELSALFAAQDQPGSDVALKRFLVDALTTLDLPARAAAAAAAPSERPPWLRDLLARVDAGLDEDLRPARLARLAGRSPEHLARSFRAHLGITPTEHVNRARLERAALLLTHSNRPIIDICHETGFNNLTYFYRLFRRAHGLTPKAWRRAHSTIAYEWDAAGSAE